jgi:UDP-N-acetylglucosamine acyltransferase
MASFIHETAIIDWDTVKIGEDCYIGPYCVLSNCELRGSVRLSSHVVIGSPPEITGFTGSGFGVLIGSGVTIREFVTIHSGSKRTTIICADAQVFRHAHIAHDCLVGEAALVSGGAIMCGHAVLGSHAVLAAGAILHQFVVVGAGAFIGAGSFLDRHVRPLDKVASRGPVSIGNNDRAASKVDFSLAMHSFYEGMERHDPTGSTKETKVL